MDHRGDHIESRRRCAGNVTLQIAVPVNAPTLQAVNVQEYPLNDSQRVSNAFITQSIIMTVTEVASIAAYCASNTDYAIQNYPVAAGVVSTASRAAMFANPLGHAAYAASLSNQANQRRYSV